MRKLAEKKLYDHFLNKCCLFVVASLFLLTTMASGIYKITSIAHPDRVYVGSAQNLKKRQQTHFNQLKKGKHINYLLAGHIKKYGIEDLKFEVIEECPLESLLVREQLFIDTIKPSFNICRKAGNTLGRKWTHQARLKRGKTQLRLPIPSREHQQLQINFFELIAEPILFRQRTGANRNHYRCLVCGKIFILTQKCIANAKCKCQRIYKIQEKIKKRLSLKNGYNVMRKDNTSGYPGIVWDKKTKKWRARIKHKGKLLDAGRFYTAKEAHIARQAKLVSMKVPIRPIAA